MIISSSNLLDSKLKTWPCNYIGMNSRLYSNAQYKDTNFGGRF